MDRLRPPAVAGMFYPDNPGLLAAMVDALLGGAPAVATAHRPKALIVPHAGYIYSGDTAAQAYALLAPWRETIRRVVLLGPTHRVAVNGLAIPTVAAFATPLGEVRLDTAAIAALGDLPQVVSSDRVHGEEHSLEVDDFALVPLAVGHASAQAVAEVLDRLWGGAETLIVVSSDLSHFLPYGEANTVDSDTCRHILALDSHIATDQACGAFPINGLMLAAGRRGLTPRLIHRCNSGDTAGDKQRVVGYAAFVLEEDHA